MQREKIREKSIELSYTCNTVSTQHLHCLPERSIGKDEEYFVTMPLKAGEAEDDVGIWPKS